MRSSRPRILVQNLGVAVIVAAFCTIVLAFVGQLTWASAGAIWWGWLLFGLLIGLLRGRPGQR